MPVGVDHGRGTKLSLWTHTVETFDASRRWSQSMRVKRKKTDELLKPLMPVGVDHYETKRYF